MQDKHAVASLHASRSKKRLLWKAAIKWPLYSVAVMPVILAAGWTIGAGKLVRLDQLLGFLVASVLLLLWENLTNDLFDDETGIDEFAKPHSVVQLIGKRSLVSRYAYFALILGLIIIINLAWRSSFAVLGLVLASCSLGYLYQGPPFRLGYQGLGEPLCWLAFGPFATAAALLVLSPSVGNEFVIPWGLAFKLGSGPALATTLVLFCSHFHQVSEDAAHGKKSPLVLIGTARAASLIPWILSAIYLLELLPVFLGDWPITSLLAIVGLPSGIKLVRLLSHYHDQPDLIRDCKFIALRFQALNGLGLSIGLGLSSFFWVNSLNSF